MELMEVLLAHQGPFAMVSVFDNLATWIVLAAIAGVALKFLPYCLWLRTPLRL
jgi:hypothetical protein